MAFTLPRLPPGEFDYPSFQIWWQQVVEAVEAEVGALEAADAANAAAIAAAAAAAAANAAAASANTAATAAQTTADAITEADSLAKSFVTGTPPILSATDAGADATINIGAHTRNYPQPDGSLVSVSVSAGSVTALAYDTYYFIYYVDAGRAGGAVTYLASEASADAAQIGDTHCVGGIKTPAAAAGDTSGNNVEPPGPGQLEKGTA